MGNVLDKALSGEGENEEENVVSETLKLAASKYSLCLKAMRGFSAVLSIGGTTVQSRHAERVL